MVRDWSGNMRGLENAREHAMVCLSGGAIEPEAFPQSGVGGQTDPALEDAAPHG